MEAIAGMISGSGMQVWNGLRRDVRNESNLPMAEEFTKTYSYGYCRGPGSPGA